MYSTAKGFSSSRALLHAASVTGQLAVAKEVLKRGAKVDLPSNLGITSLMLAAEQHLHAQS